MSNESDRRTIVFNFDGTGNEPADAEHFVEDESITNVLKLHILLGGGMSPSGTVVGNGQGRQLAFYYNGIGTREEGRSLPGVGWIVSTVNMMFAPKWGDANRILREAMADFDRAYRPGDRVVVFGYSRGAALARKFVSMLPDRECQNIAFLGVFDTVAALDGVQRPGEDVATDVLFEDGTIDRRVERAVHIVALDEDRLLFRPTLINKDDASPKRITEIWFPGVHGDVGGGYWHDGLSDSALEFMIEQCKRALPNKVDFCNAADLASLLDELKKTDDELSGIELDDIALRSLTNGPPHAHSGTLLKVGGRQPRRVRVNRDDKATNDEPLVHTSVLERFRTVPAYRPPALRGVTFKLWDGASAPYPVWGIYGLSKCN